MRHFPIAVVTAPDGVRIEYTPSLAWPTWRVELLVTRYFEDVPFPEIATELEKTRNAVIGKLNILGILGMRERPKGRPPVEAPDIQPAPGGGRINKKPPAPNVNQRRSHHAGGGTTDPKSYPSKHVRPKVIVSRDIEAEISPIAQRRSWSDLTDDVCHWPIGDPSSRDFAYCGQVAEPRVRTANGYAPGPYCSYHAHNLNHSNGHTRSFIPKRNQGKGKLCQGARKTKTSRLQMAQGRI